LEPILQVGPAKDLKAGSLTDVCLLSRNRQPQFWLSLLNGISYVINASAEARKCFGDFILDFVKKKLAVKDSQIIFLLGVLIDIGSESYTSPLIKDEIDIDGDVDIVIGVDSEIPVYYRIPASKKTAKDSDIIFTIKSILSYFTWLRPTTNTDLVSLNDCEKVLYAKRKALGDEVIKSEDKRKADAKVPKKKKKKLSDVVFLVDFCRTGVEDSWDNTKSDVNAEKEEAVVQRDSFLRAVKDEAATDQFDHQESISMVVIKWDCLGKRELYRVEFVIEELSRAQQEFMLLIGRMKRPDNLTQIVATPLQHSTFATFKAVMNSLIELCCLKKIKAALKKGLKDEVKRMKKEGEDAELVPVFNVAWRIEQLRESIVGSSIARGFSFDDKTVFTAKTTKVYAVEGSSVGRVIKSLSKGYCFEWFAPAIDSQVVIGIVDKFAGRLNGYFSRKSPHSRFLFENFERGEYSYLALKYNETENVVGGKDWRFSNGLFHVDARHVSILLESGQVMRRIKKTSGDVSLRLDKIAVQRRRQREIDIIRVNCVRFAFDVKIRHLVGSKTNVSRFVNAALVSSKGGPAEFRRDKYGNITMHLPVSADVNHTGRNAEVNVLDEDELEDDVCEGPGKSSDEDMEMEDELDPMDEDELESCESHSMDIDPVERERIHDIARVTRERLERERVAKAKRRWYALFP
jgi:hypothetical protein